MAKRDGQEDGEELQSSADGAELVRQRSVEEMVQRWSRSYKQAQKVQRRSGRGRSKRWSRDGQEVTSRRRRCRDGAAEVGRRSCRTEEKIG